MTETRMQPPPLTNQELSDLHSLNLAETHYQDYDESRPDFTTPDQLPLHGASERWTAHQLESAAADTDAEPLVRQTKQGDHELLADSLTVDAETLSSFVSFDLRGLRNAIAHPHDTRTSLESYFSDKVEPDSISTAPLNVEEVIDWLEMKRQIEQSDDPHERALHSISIDVAKALVVNWEQQVQEQRGNTDTRAVLADLQATPAEGVNSLGTHLSEQRGNFESRFHEIHRQKIQKLGVAVTDAAGVRQRLSGETGAESRVESDKQSFLDYLDSNFESDQAADATAEDAAIEAARRILEANPPASRRERIDALSEQVRSTMLRDTKEVDNMLGQVWDAAERTGASRQETVQQQYKWLLTCVQSWLNGTSEADRLQGTDFGGFMQHMRQSQDERVEHYADINEPIPPQEQHVMDAFDAAWRIYEGGSHRPSHSFSNVVNKVASQRAIRQIDGNS